MEAKIEKGVTSIKCFGCGNWLSLDDDQVNGRKEIACLNPICSFRSTFSVAEKMKEAKDEAPKVA